MNVKLLVPKIILYLFLWTNFTVFSQKIIQGKVCNLKTKKSVENVLVRTINNKQGTTTNKNGFFELNVPMNTTQIHLSLIGFKSKIITLDKKINLNKLFLEELPQKLPEITISATNSIVKERRTPIAASTLKAKYILKNIGTKDLPELLNNTPSIYATKNGGAYGDVSISVRGFDQSNIAVLINNIPVNDMETGKVYWSNWLNLPQVTSVIQVQRGLGASKLAIPSVGGTINILTQSNLFKKGAEILYEYGSENSHKKNITYHSGLLDNGLSASIQFGHFSGKGFVDQTQAEVTSYFINIGYKNKKHQFNFTTLGAPQWHNQHNNASALLDYITYSNNNKPNIKYNSEWGFLHNDAFTWSTNYFHKPIISLNWDWNISNNTKLATSFYGIFGKGGGTAPVGAINYNYPSSNIFKTSKGLVNFDAIYNWNSGKPVSNFGSTNLPNSQGKYINAFDKGLTKYGFINNQLWYGTILNLKQKINKNLKLDVGFDGRITSGKNALVVNNTLGADGYLDNFNINQGEHIIYPKDYVEAKPNWNVFKSIDNLNKIIFFNQSKVKWFSIFTQLEYTKSKVSAFIQAGISNQHFQRIDYFNLPKDINNDGIVEPQKSKWKILNGGNIKIGANYNINQQHHVFLNTGFYSKQPLFNSVFTNYSNNAITKNLTNEKIKAIELGYGFKSKYFKAITNVYYTSWKDRFTVVNSFFNNQNLTGRLEGLNEIHKGIELETQTNYKSFKLNTMISLGNWYYKGNVNNVNLYDTTQQLITNKDFYLDNVKVGDAPQFTASYTAIYKITPKLEWHINQLFVDKLYAKIDISNFSNKNHNGSLKLPYYNVINTGINYTFNIPNIAKATINILVNNASNTTYISRSETNYFKEEGQDNWNGINTKNKVFFGWGRNYNIGLKLTF